MSLCGVHQGEAAPLAVFGLLQHEAKLSVLNFGVRKAAAFEEPLPNKAPLLLVTGIRCAPLLCRKFLLLGVQQPAWHSLPSNNARCCSSTVEQCK